MKAITVPESHDVTAPSREQVKKYLEDRGYQFYFRFNDTDRNWYKHPDGIGTVPLWDSEDEGARLEEIEAIADSEQRDEIAVYRDIMGIQHPPTLFQVLKALDTAKATRHNTGWEWVFDHIGGDAVVWNDRLDKGNYRHLKTEEEVYAWLREVVPEAFV